MAFVRFFLLFFLLVGFGIEQSTAQEGPPGDPARALLGPELQDRLVEGDPLLSFRTTPVPGGRLDADEGVWRAAYHIGAPAVEGGSVVAAAHSYLMREAERFGLAAGAPGLEVVSARKESYRGEVVFQQVFAGLPVYRRQVKVNLDLAGRPTLVLNAYAPHLDAVRGFDPRPRLTAAEAAERVRQAVSGGVETEAPELVVYPSKPPRLAWRLVTRTQTVFAEWEVLVDARTGEIFRLIDQTLHAHVGASPVASPAAPPPGAEPERGAARPAARVPAAALVDGTGLVFDPDPLSTAGVEYGPPYVDANDADVAELNAQRLEVTLNSITQGNDGRYRLEGPYVRIDGDRSLGGTSYDPPAETTPNFRYTRADQHFEAVMVYYHIDKSQRYVQALDIGRAVQNGPIRVNPHGYGSQDDSRYILGLNAIGFGDGGIDDAEDADVIWHEYAHALLEASARGLFTASFEGKALHEGWADYWAASYSRFLVEEDPRVPATGNWRKVYTWDGNTDCWEGRPLTHPGHYPDQTAFVYPGCFRQSFYEYGLLWATTIMEVYDDLGRAVTDRLHLAALGYLSAPVSLRDAAEALLQADRDLYGGSHLGVLIARLGQRGFIDPALYGPTVSHQPLASTEQLGGTVPITVQAVGASASVDSVLVYYDVGGAGFERLILTPAGGDLYRAELPLPSQSTTVAYYVEVVDVARQRVRDPVGAPAQRHRFAVGPDQEPPRITHDALPGTDIDGWPVDVVAAVEDDLGVDSVWVTYAIEDPSQGVVEEGTFRLAQQQGLYVGRFPGSAVGEGYEIRYQIHARDLSLSGNEAVTPLFSFTIDASGILRTFNFEGVNQGFLAQGAWELGQPGFGLKTAHSGQQAWGTLLDRAYPDEQQRSALDLPPLDLSRSAEAFLVFWHWYDLEHDGRAVPDRRTSAFLWDGGNVKASTDGGLTWQVLQPEDDYDGTIEGGFGNPLGGEPGFGGYSFGWRREIVPLPQAGDVRVRFDFGTDGSNAEEALFYAGWFIDDVVITTRRPVDTAPPVALALPEAHVVRSAAQGAPPVIIRAEDDTGVAAAWIAYEVTRGGIRASADTLRLAQHVDDLQAFSGAFSAAHLFETGDRLTYTIHLRDFDGNTSVYRAANQAPFTVLFQFVEEAELLTSVTASGVWQPQAVGRWRASGGGGAERSSLVFAPIDLPSNASSLSFVLQHQYHLGQGAGGNVKVSADNGDTWQVLVPEGQYPSVLAAGEGHPMAGEQVFEGHIEAVIESRFGLDAYAGLQVRLRVDLGAARPLGVEEFWTLRSARTVSSTDDDAFETPRTLRLLPNFPNPFDAYTTLSYTLPDRMPVTLEVYDLLGRRVAQLVRATQDAGTYTLRYESGGLASGVYLLRLQAGAAQHVERMVVAR